LAVPDSYPASMRKYDGHPEGRTTLTSAAGF
jgi:hypothetical protein